MSRRNDWPQTCLLTRMCVLLYLCPARQAPSAPKRWKARSDKELAFAAGASSSGLARGPESPHQRLPIGSGRGDGTLCHGRRPTPLSLSLAPAQVRLPTNLRRPARVGPPDVPCSAWCAASVLTSCGAPPVPFLDISDKSWYLLSDVRPLPAGAAAWGVERARRSPTRRRRRTRPCER